MSEQDPKTNEEKGDQEDEVVVAIGSMLAALRPLDDDARLHVLEFVIKRLGIPIASGLRHLNTNPQRRPWSRIKSLLRNALEPRLILAASPPRRTQRR